MPRQGVVQARALDETTIVIRQSPCVDYEAPLMYLLIGGEKALLIDSGASDETGATAQLTQLVEKYLVREGGARMPLVVAHTHGHQDHRSGDAAFAALPGTTVVPTDPPGLRQFFGFTTWPDTEVRLDLGGREIVIVPTPGHHPDHLVFLDMRTRLLFSGDYLLPGRLLVDELEPYQDSTRRMIEVVTTYGVRHALGAHVEMSVDGELYSSGSTYHANERPVTVRYDTRAAQALHGALMDFNGFYSTHPDYAVVDPVHNLIALAAGVAIALVLLTLLIRRLRRQLKARRAALTG